MSFKQSLKFGNATHEALAPNELTSQQNLDKIKSGQAKSASELSPKTFSNGNKSQISSANGKPQQSINYQKSLNLSGKTGIIDLVLHDLNLQKIKIVDKFVSEDGIAPISDSPYVNPNYNGSDLYSGISKFRPEIILVTDFLPVFKPNAKEPDVNHIDFFDPGFTPAGKMIDLQIQSRRLIAENVIDLLNSLETNPGLSQSIAARKIEFQNKIDAASARVDFIESIFQTIDRMKQAFDIRDFTKNFLGNTNRDIITLLKDESKFSESNIQKFTNTKIMMLFLRELGDFLHFGTYSISSKFNPRYPADDNPTQLPASINHSDFLSFFTQIQTQKLSDPNVQKVGVLEQGPGVFPSLSSTTIKEPVDPLDAVYNGFIDEYRKIVPSSLIIRPVFLLNNLARELRISRSLSRPEIKSQLLNSYGINLDNTTFTFDPIVGIPGVSIDDQVSGVAKSLIAMTSLPLGQTNVLPFETAFFTSNTNQVYVPGTSYYIDSLLEGKKKFDVTPLKSFVDGTAQNIQEAVGLIKQIFFAQTSDNVFISIGLTKTGADETPDKLLSAESILTTMLIEIQTALKFVANSAYSGALKYTSIPWALLRAAAQSRDVYVNLLKSFLAQHLPLPGGDLSLELNKRLIAENMAVTDKFSATINDRLGAAIRNLQTTSGDQTAATITDSSIQISGVEIALTPDDEISPFRSIVFAIEHIMKGLGDGFSGEETKFNKLRTSAITLVLFDVLVTIVASLKIPIFFTGDVFSTSFASASGGETTTYTSNIVVDSTETKAISAALGDILDALSTGPKGRPEPIFPPPTSQVEATAILKNIKDRLTHEDETILEMLDNLSGFKAILQQKTQDIITEFSTPDNQTKLAELESEIGPQLSSIDRMQLVISNAQIQEIKSGLSQLKSPFLDDTVTSETMRSSLFNLLRAPAYTEPAGSNSRILSIGIPAGFYKGLIRKKFSLDQVDDPKFSNIIQINLYKQDLEFQDLIFHPIISYFDITKFFSRAPTLGDSVDSISYGDSMATTLHALENALQTYDKIIFSESHLNDYPEAVSPSVVDWINKNTVVSYILELYIKLLTGISVAESNFLIDTKLSTTFNLNSSTFFNSVLEQQVASISNQPPVSQNFLSAVADIIGGSSSTVSAGSQGTIAINPTLTAVISNFITAGSIDPANIQSVISPDEQGRLINTDGLKFDKKTKEVLTQEFRNFAHLFRGKTIMSDGTVQAKKIISPKIFERIFNVIVDSDDFFIDKTATMSNQNGLIMFNRLLQERRITSRGENFSLSPRPKTEAHVSLEKYFVTVSLYQGNQAPGVEFNQQYDLRKIAK